MDKNLQIFFLFLGPGKWKAKRKYQDARANAALILEHSNVCPFRWARGMFKCAFCPLTFPEFKDLKNHRRTHESNIHAMQKQRLDNIKIEISNLNCTICNINIKDLDNLVDHLVNTHEIQFKSKDLGVISYILNSDEYNCTHCDAKYESFNKLNTHMNEHYPNNICFHCGKAFSAITRLKAHLSIHEGHKATRTKETPQSTAKHRYRCPICKETFVRYSERSKHLRQMHDKTIEYPCHLCKSVFNGYNLRTKHIRQVHMKITSFFCDTCCYKSVTAVQLKRHKIKHDPNCVKYECHFCKKSFSRPASLKEHIRIHNNDKKFKCEHCNYCSVQKCSLNSHIKTHNHFPIDRSG